MIESPKWKCVVISAYPQIFPGALEHGVTGRALREGIWGLQTLNLRDFAEDKHRTIDGSPIGGGSGMVYRPDVLGRAHDRAMQLHNSKVPTVVLTPRGKKMHQRDVIKLAEGEGINLIAGRFEGIDERFIEERADLCLSIGDYVLSGGEIPALVLLDAITRLIPGVLGNSESIQDESFGAFDEGGSNILQHSHYTLPRVWKGREVPNVLLSGDHQAIKKWRQQESRAASEKFAKQ